MPKKITAEPTVEEKAIKNEASNAPANNEDDGFDTGDHTGEPVNTFKPPLIQWRNPYNGNAKPVRDGGFAIATSQVENVKELFPIGPEMEMKPMKGDPYKALVSPELEFTIVGSSPVYYGLDQNQILTANGLEPIKGGWIIADKWVAAEANGKKICGTQRDYYVVIKGDTKRKVYRISASRTQTKEWDALMSQISKILAGYQTVMTEVRGKQQNFPPHFTFWWKVGPGEFKSVGAEGQTSQIAPPVLIGEIPEDLSGYKAMRLSQEEYNEMGKIHEALKKDFLDTPNAPHYRGKPFASEFLELVDGVNQMAMGADGQYTMVGSGRPALPSGKASTQKKTSDDNLTPAAYVEKNGKAALDEFIAKSGATKEQIAETLSVIEAKDILDVDIPLAQFLEAAADS